ncbi:SemiSWEET family sugar transporter [Dokdonia sp. Hel_I_53]|uniref:SemiSWEET family sugar transporter n=1 Tax=Dokdonia sp. Hel_I_53 TaxID=1566287 RepID=UPI00119BD59D|nr:SemiSWEET transporter [Dokdonia sp. Hel_I_53]TVZ52850.1 MtN3 and saliva related transmembrane protein [Dokdonia sp. Hel_I_53]
MVNIDGIEIIGLIAAALTTAAFLPQVYQTWKTKDVSGLNLYMLALFFAGVSLWFVYGIFKESLALLLANGITIVSVFLLVFFKLKYGKKSS